jgi:hypothetical protein
MRSAQSESNTTDKTGAQLYRPMKQIIWTFKISNSHSSHTSTTWPRFVGTLSEELLRKFDWMKWMSGSMRINRFMVIDNASLFGLFQAQHLFFCFIDSNSVCFLFIRNALVLFQIYWNWGANIHHISKISWNWNWNNYHITRFHFNRNGSRNEFKPWSESLVTSHIQITESFSIKRNLVIIDWSHFEWW